MRSPGHAGPWAALLADAGAPAGLALLTVLALGATVFAAQTLSRTAILPGLLGGGQVWLGSLPATLVIALPVALLVGSVSAGRAWREGGDWIALAASGRAARGVVPGVLLVGLLGGAVEAGLTHYAEPLGRRMVRQALVHATEDLRLRPGQAVVLGDLLLRAGGITQVPGEATRYQDLFVASSAVVASARFATVQAGGVLSLEQGTARSLDPDGWSARFSQARFLLPAPARRVELSERSTTALDDLIDRMSAAGRPAKPERLALYKRTALPLSVPLLVLIGLPLGSRRVQPAVAALTVVLGWWAVMRLCDQVVGSIGPVVAVALPPALLLLATTVTWATWSER